MGKNNRKWRNFRHFLEFEKKQQKKKPNEKKQKNKNKNKKNPENFCTLEIKNIECKFILVIISKY